MVRCGIVRYKGNFVNKTIGFDDWIGIIGECKKEDKSELSSSHEYRYFSHGLRTRNRILGLTKYCFVLYSVNNSFLFK